MLEQGLKKAVPMREDHAAHICCREEYGLQRGLMLVREVPCRLAPVGGIAQEDYEKGGAGTTWNGLALITVPVPCPLSCLWEEGSRAGQGKKGEVGEGVLKIWLFSFLT